ncbi:MAG TPA: hypothetical protein VLT79_05820 [Gemmatimonadales bacterium]|nr:hypothetical protein [Gemmatimonadales bacterium]
MRIMVFALLLAGFAAARAEGQSTEFAPAIHAAAALRLASSPGSAEQSLAFTLEPAVKKKNKNRSLSATLMLVGAGAILVGAIAGGGGGTVLIVGGVVCAGYGVYLYAQ